MILTNFYIKLKKYGEVTYNKIFKPKTISDNITGTLLAFVIVFIIIFYIEKLISLYFL